MTIDLYTTPDDLDGEFGPLVPVAGEPEAGFARGHHADVAQGIQNGDFSDPPRFPDLPINNESNKLAGWELVDGSNGKMTAQWFPVADTERGIVRVTITAGATTDDLYLRQPIPVYELSYHPIGTVQDPSVAEADLTAEVLAQYIDADGVSVGTGGGSLQQSITFANLNTAADQRARC